MKLLDKIKNAIFEDDEFEELEKTEEEKIREEKIDKQEEVVKKIDIERTIPKKIEIPKEEVNIQKEQKPLKREQLHRKTPVIFNEEDFIMEEKKHVRKKAEVKKVEEPKKPLYGGYKEDKPKEKFKPSPIISPVYGFVGVSPILEKPRNEEISSFNEMKEKEQEKKHEVTLDAVRQKAFGLEQEDDDLGLLYDMKKDDTPAISKVTLGDAEEYFDDLGLEYNVDYKDSLKEKQNNIQSKSTRSTKNKELSKKVDKEMQNIKKLESTRELEITKEQLKPKTAKEIKKVKKIADSDLGMSKDDMPDEKNLYDLIDMMYESK